MHMKFLKFLIIISVYPLSLQGQSIPNITLQRVDCHAPAMADCWVPLRRPPSYAHPNPNDPRTIVWRKRPFPPATTSFSGPAAYVSGCRGRMSAQFSIPPDGNCPKTITVKAEAVVGQATYRLPAQQLTYVKDTLWEYKTQEFDMPFEQFKVQYLPTFTVKWFVSCDTTSPGAWVNAGTSTNTLYIVHQKPIEGAEGLGEPTSFLQDCIHISCENAHGKGRTGSGTPVSNEVVNAIYDKFKTLCVKKLNGSSCLKYWGNPTAAQACNGIQEFLQYGDATCSEWAKIFNDMLRLQGIEGSKVTLVTYGIEAGDRGFLSINDRIRLNTDIKTFFGADSSKVTPIYLSNAPAGYENVPVTLLFIKNHSFVSTSQYFYLYDKPTSDTATVTATQKVLFGANGQRILAQNNYNNSPGDFTNHTIVKYGDQYFDPSYGTPGMPAIPWESSGMAGFGVRLRYTKPGTTMPINIVWIAEIDNPQTQQTMFKFN